MADKTPKKAPTKAAEKSVEEQLKDARQDLLDSQKTHRSGELVNPQVIGAHRKQIARLMTKLSANRNLKKTPMKEGK